MKNYKRSLLIAALPLVLSLSASAQAPSISTSGTVNAADYSRDFAPGAIISIFGTNLSVRNGQRRIGSAANQPGRDHRIGHIGREHHRPRRFFTFPPLRSTHSFPMASPERQRSR